MKKNRTLIIITGIALAIILVFSLGLVIKHGIDNKTPATIINIDNYKLVVHGKSVDSKPENSYFTTSFKEINRIDKEYYIIYVDFLETVSQNATTYTDGYGHIQTINKQKQLRIRDKKYSYNFDNNYTCGGNATLYYDIPNSDDMLIIKVRGGEIYFFDGAQAKCLTSVTESTLRNKKLKNVLDFKIEFIDKIVQ